MRFIREPMKCWRLKGGGFGKYSSLKHLFCIICINILTYSTLAAAVLLAERRTFWP